MMQSGFKKFICLFIFWAGWLGISSAGFCVQGETHSMFGYFDMKDCPRSEKELDEIRKESEEIEKRSLATAKLYDLDENYKDITAKVIEHEYTYENRKNLIKNQNRKFILFEYPSGDLKIKGIFSYIPSIQQKPLIIYLRGGNRTFGLPHPSWFADYQDYPVVMTTYRGGVSEGEDEFGGQDILDVKSLIEFIPRIEEHLNISFKGQKYNLLGVSRGGMQMFLALEHFPEIQNETRKVASLSGLLDMQFAVSDRPDFRDMLIEDFGMPGEDPLAQKQWIEKRTTLSFVDKINKDLPILIIQGRQDKRVCLLEGLNMLKALQAKGQNVTYWEEEQGEHTLHNIPEFQENLIHWFEEG